MSSQKLVQVANRQLDSITDTRLQRHANANDGKGSEWLQKRIKRTERPMCKDKDTGKWFFA